MSMLNRLGRRTLGLLACTATLGGGIFVEACSSSSGSGFSADDAGTDATINNNGSDGGTDGSMSGNSDSAAGDAGGHCTPIKGACDIVLQDCPKSKTGQAQECVASGNNGNFTTQCAPAQASEQLPTGRACCPSNNSNPCLPGLECIGDPCPDAGPDAAAAVQTGRCSPHCCTNDQCGVSDPEGISGSCDVTLVSGGKDLYYVCTYKETCKPLGVQPCKSANTACEVQDKFGSGNCGPIFGAPAKEHELCDPSKQCGDGTMCFLKSFPDGGQVYEPDGSVAQECLYLCHTPNSATPFDGGLLTSAAGHGGCPGGETCKLGLDPSQFPAWLSLCGP